MIIKVSRYYETKTFTISDVYIDDVWSCKGLEDEKREKKVMHETRIPEGNYLVTLRTFGKHHEAYKRFPEHKGMLWVMDVPGFKDILIHIGNTDKDTSGCLLIGQSVDQVAGVLLNSTKAYRKFYRQVIQAFDRREQVRIIYETTTQEKA